MIEIIAKRKVSPLGGSRGGHWGGDKAQVGVGRGGGLRTCNEQRVHARRRLGGLEHFGNVLLGQRGLASALPLGVLLLPPLEVLGRQSRGNQVKIRKNEAPRQAGKNIWQAQRERWKETRRSRDGWEGETERGVFRADRDGVICGGDGW